MNIVFMGTPDFAVPSLQALIDAGHNVRAVFTQPDKPKGRGMRLTPPPVKELAQKYGIEVFQPQSLKRETETCMPIIRSLSPDVIVVVAYGKLLPPEILEIPPLGCVNVHGSLLPKYRGAAPIQHTVLNGDEFGGVTTMLMAEGMDTGDILLKKEVKLLENETSSELFDRLAPIGADLLLETLDGLAAGKIVPQKQDESAATLAPMLSKQMSPTDFNRPAKAVHRQILGLSDWPCATALLSGKKIKIYRAELVREFGSSGVPGEVMNPADLTVACAEGSVRLTELQPEGSKRMSARDYLRGHPVKKGEIILPE